MNRQQYQAITLSRKRRGKCRECPYRHSFRESPAADCPALPPFRRAGCHNPRIFPPCTFLPRPKRAPMIDHIDLYTVHISGMAGNKRCIPSTCSGRVHVHDLLTSPPHCLKRALCFREGRADYFPAWNQYLAICPLIRNLNASPVSPVCLLRPRNAQTGT